MDFMKHSTALFFLMMAGLLLTACSTDSNSSAKLLRNQTGKLIWGGIPAADGVGILFEVGDKLYGASGTREDYSHYFPEDENEVQIRADILITGEETTRGWGATYPAIEFIRIKRI